MSPNSDLDRSSVGMELLGKYHIMHLLDQMDHSHEYRSYLKGTIPCYRL